MISLPEYVHSFVFLRPNHRVLDLHDFPVELTIAASCDAMSHGRLRLVYNFVASIAIILCGRHLSVIASSDVSSHPVGC